MVNNGSGVPHQVYNSSHAYTENTQTNWNGIIGQIVLSTSTSLEHPVTDHQAFKDFHIEGKHFYANGHKIFLRGRHDACVWPLTGHVPMDIETWRRYFAVCEAYGLNHVRFHSWCPPEAAFAAADEYGIYLQPELPFWGNFDARDNTLMNFLFKEGENILREYGHHPSFRMFALGNELSGNLDKMAEFIAHYRTIAPDKIYTFNPNYYLGFQGVKPGNDYFVTQMHTNWQWFPVIKASHPFKLDNTAADYRPIVQVIDNVERNHKLGLVFEFTVGKGKLLIVMSDLDKASQYPEGRQFYLSVLEYMTSKHFTPDVRISIKDFRQLTTTKVVTGEIGKLHNTSSYKEDEYTK